MSFFVSSSSSGGGSGFVFGSYIGSGGGGSFSSGFASYSRNPDCGHTSGPRYYRQQTNTELILCGILIFLAFPVCSIILLMIGNAILRDSGHHHFANHDMAAIGAIGGIFLYVICIAVCLLLDPIVRRFRITTVSAPPGDFVIFLIALFGAPLCGVLGVSPLLAKKDKFHTIDLLYVTEAGFIGAAVLVGGWYALLFGLILLFNPSYAGFIAAQIFHIYRFRLRFRRRTRRNPSRPAVIEEAAAEAEVPPPAYEQSSAKAKVQEPENTQQNSEETT